MILGMDPLSYYLPTRSVQDRHEIADSAIAIWDGSHRDRELIVALLNQIAKVRRSIWSERFVLGGKVQTLRWPVRFARLALRSAIDSRRLQNVFFCPE